jgi:hypothetical protein
MIYNTFLISIKLYKLHKNINKKLFKLGTNLISIIRLKYQRIQMIFDNNWREKGEQN